MSLYEGTNGIQSMDLMGRKMSIRNGACFTSGEAVQKGKDVFRGDLVDEAIIKFQDIPLDDGPV